MLTFRYVIMVPLLIAAATNTFAASFPKAPPDIKAAEAKGFQRVNVENLKKFIPGVIEMKGHKGGKHKLTFKADGSIDRTGGVANLAKTGKWHFDEKNNAYCTAFQEARGSREACFAVFRAPRGKKFFDYGIEDSFLAHVWSPVK